MLLWSLRRAPTRPVAHLQDMLRLNPGDNQGVRYLLAAHLLDLGRDAEFDVLVDQYDETSAFISFSKLLREFRRTGDSPAARKLLAQARRSNKFVVPLLLQLPALSHEHPPEMYSPGDRNEALLYMADFACGWKQELRGRHLGCAQYRRRGPPQRIRPNGLPSVRQRPSRSNSPVCRRNTARSGRRPSVAYPPGCAMAPGWFVRGRFWL